MRYAFRPLRYAAATGALAALSLFSGSCARVPQTTPTGASRVFLIVNMTVRGQIQPNDATTPYYYFCLINLTDNATDAGPVPVVGQPWGNGFAATTQSDAQGFVGYVLYNRFQGQGGYGLYSAPRNANDEYLPAPQVPFPQFVPLGQPDSYRTPQLGEARLTFQVDLNRLKEDTDATTLPAFVQVNFITTDRIPNNPDDNPPKLWDALGASTVTGTLNYFVTLPTAQNVIRSNTDIIGEAQEPSNDVRDRTGPLIDEPNLDIVDWSVEIRRQ